MFACLSRRAFVLLAAVLFVAASPIAQAGQPAAAFGVDFSDCVESIGVGLAPTDNVLALTPPDFIPLPIAPGLSAIVVRTATCDIAVDGRKAKSGSIVQIGTVIVPPDGAGDINNYTFWYYTTDAKLAQRLEDLGVSAQHAETIRYDLEPGTLDVSNDLSVIVRRPGDPRFTVAGTVIPTTTPSGSFEAIWSQQTGAGKIRMDTNVPVIAISSANLTLTTDASNALGQLIGGSTLGFPIIQPFNLFSSAHMAVTIAP